MALYESVIIARQDVTPQQFEVLTEQLKGIVTAQGGSITKTENWGLRTLAYKINKNRKGHYVLLNIDAPAAAVLELERNMKINEEILRFMTVRVDELEAGPSAILRKDRDFDRADAGYGYGDRPSRGDRGDRGYRPRASRGDNEGEE